MIYSVTNLLFPIITSMYAARILLPEGLGRVSYAQNVVSYFVVLAALGIPTYGIRETAKVRDDPQKRNRLFTELLLINGITTAIALVLFLLLLHFSDDFAKDRMLFLCCGIQLILNSINVDWFFRGYEEYVYIVIRSMTIRVISILAVFLFIHTRDDYIIYALISSISAAGNNIFNIIHVRKYVKLEFRGLKIVRHFQPILILAVSSFLGTIYSRLDITMLGSMATKTSVGLYSSAHRLVDIVTTLCCSVALGFLPRLSNCYENDRERFFHYLEIGICALLFFVPPVYVGLNIVAPHGVLLVYGEAFAPAILTIRILSGIILVKSFGDLLCYQVAISTGNEKKRLPAYVIAAALNVILNAILIPQYAQNGAAMASVASELLLNGYLLFTMRKIVPIHINRTAILQALASTAVMAGCVVGIGQIQVGLLLSCILMVGCGGAAYILANYIMRNQMLFAVLKKIKTGKSGK